MTDAPDPVRQPIARPTLTPPPAAGGGNERTPMFRMLGAIVVPFMALVSRTRVEGGENVPREGSFVLVPNHYSEIDPLVVAVAMWKRGRAPRFLAKASLFRVPVLGGALRGTGQIPVERAGGGADPLRAAGDLVDEGRAVIIYPEGTLTRDPELWPMRGKGGAVRAALGRGIPIIPVAHWGAQHLLPRYGKRLRLGRPRITVRFGAPVDLSRFAGRPLDGSVVTEATNDVMTALTTLVAELRDETPPAERWDPAQHGQKENGRL